jgi:hypothetical protein
MNEEKPTLVRVSTNEVPKLSAAEQDEKMNSLVAEYGRTVDVKPEWCVWQNDGNGMAQVLMWVAPVPEGELVARRIAKYLQSRNVSAGVEMTEWNPNQHGTPIYAQKAEHEPEKN